MAQKVDLESDSIWTKECRLIHSAVKLMAAGLANGDGTVKGLLCLEIRGVYCVHILLCLR